MSGKENPAELFAKLKEFADASPAGCVRPAMFDFEPTVTFTGKRTAFADSTTAILDHKVITIKACRDSASVFAETISGKLEPYMKEWLEMQGQNPAVLVFRTRQQSKKLRRLKTKLRKRQWPFILIDEVGHDEQD